MTRITCVSDLHGHFPELPGGDLLIVAGDLTAHDYREEYFEFFQWLLLQNYKKKILVAGNHDNHLKFLYTIPEEKTDLSYLCDSGTEFTYHIDGFPEEDEGFLPSGKRTLKIWGSPWTRRFKGMNPNCMAFTCETEEELAEKWALIPRNIDILVTHSPPWNWLDKVIGGDYAGSHTLLDYISKWKPRLHIFGHIHEGYGQERSFFGRRNFGNKYGVTMINASHVNERYEPVNKPIEVEL